MNDSESESETNTTKDRRVVWVRRLGGVVLLVGGILFAYYVETYHDDVFWLIVDWIANSRILPWILLILAIIVSLVMMWIAGRTLLENDDLRFALQRSQWHEADLEAVVLLMFGLYRNFDELLVAKDTLAAARRISREFLRDTTKVLGESVMRSYILLQEGDMLIPFVGEAMPDPVDYERTFYVGSDKNQNTSVAAECFRHSEVRVVHVDVVDGMYIHDDPDFLQLVPDSRDPNYRSFICVPISFRTDNIGVLCIDSGERSAFDDPDLQDLIFDLGSVLGSFINSAQTLASSRGPQLATPEIGGDGR